MTTFKTTSLSRRAALLAAAAGAMGGAAVRRHTSARAGRFDWKKFKGEKIEILLQKSPFHDVLQKFEPEFTALTGIEVGSEQIPEQQYRQKLADRVRLGQAELRRLLRRAGHAEAAVRQGQVAGRPEAAHRRRRR